MSNRIRVLIVDDSAYARYAISHELQSDPGIEVIGFARDGAEALERIDLAKPDVITMDVEMPNMDGLTALKNIMSTNPIPVIMLSALTGEGTDETVRALELGAVDFFLKPSPTNPAGSNVRDGNICAKIKIASQARVKKPLRLQIFEEVQPVKGKYKNSNAPTANQVVVIGTSTGGPRALYQVIPSLPRDINAAILIVQHMPKGFTKSLADRLNNASQVYVKEAEPGDVIRQGQVLLAPGGYHMVVKKRFTIGLNQDEPVCGVRPSVDVTMRSVAELFKGSSLGVILTGMGSDGTNGSSFIKAAGGRIIAEDESTCTVWGMPRSVVNSGNADRIVPLDRIASEIVSVIDSYEKVANK